jgi:hypothetical protein
MARWKTNATLWSDWPVSRPVLKTRAGLAMSGYNDLCMRRLASIAAFALALAVPVWAQHGGGGHGGGGGHAGGFGGGHAGFSGGHVGGFSAHSGVSSGFGAHALSGSSRAGVRSYARPFTRPSFSTRASRGPFLHDGFRRPFFRGYGYNNCWGYSCGWGYGYPWAGYYDPYWYNPYWFYDSDSSYDDSYNQNLAQAAEMNRENLEEQRMLRQEQADGDQDVYMQQHHNVPNAASGDEKKATPVLPSTVLVYRDQHKEEIENYAIVGQTLYSFQPQHTEKIALSSLDLPATAKANDDRGLKFSVPQAQ